MTARVKLPRFIANQKGLASREFEGEVLRHTAKGVLVKGHAVVEGSDYCRRCGRRITNPASLLVGYGPECSEHMGIPRDFRPEILEQVKEQAQRFTQVEEWFPRKYITNGWEPDDEPAYGVKDPFVDPARDWKPEKAGKFEVEVTPGIAEKFYVSFPYNPTMVEAIKTVPGRRWDKPRKVWQVPYDQAPALAECLRSATGTAPSVIMDVYRDWQAKKSQAVELSRATDANLSVPGLRGELMPFQRAGVAYALDMERVIIGDQMGLGKTIQGIATVVAAKSFPTLVVCPASLKLNWKREIEKWVPDATVSLVSGTTATSGSIRKAGFVIVNYDLLTHRLDELRALGPKAVIFDELHYIKNGGTQRRPVKRSQAALELAKGVRYVIGLTGTAIVNRPEELIHPLNVLDRLHQFGGYWGFAKRYCGAQRGQFGMEFTGGTNLKELNDKLRSTCYVRREKEQVLKELPAKRRSIVPLDITNRVEYQKAEANILKYIEDLAWTDDAILEAVSNLDDERTKESAIRAMVSDKVNRASKAEHLVRFAKLRQLAVDGKIDAAIKWIEDVVEEGNKIVVFAVHQRTIKRIAKAFDAPYINGSVPMNKRQEAVDRFQNDPTCKVIVLNIKAGGVGLTLTAASDVAFVEMGWTPGEHQQAEDRCHRIGQYDNVTAWYLVAPETVDEDLATILDEKAYVTDMVNIGEADGAATNGIMKLLLERIERRQNEHQ